MIGLLIWRFLYTFANKKERMRKKLVGCLSMDRILELCFLTQGERNNHRKEELYQLTSRKHPSPINYKLLNFTYLQWR